MTTQIMEWLAGVRENIITQADLKILEVGAVDINGSPRELFSNCEYLGTDMMEGKGVDMVVDGHDLHKHFPVNHFDVILCLETFEHDINFWVTLNNLRHLLKPGGYLIISTPTFKFPLHRHPRDYYRFGEDAFRELFFEGYEVIDLQEVISKGVNPGIVCVGRKPNG